MPLILIVDDSPTELHVMQKALEKHGYRTAAAADGAEGVRLAREMSPDLIFMDIVMPGMNGYQATRALANDPGKLKRVLRSPKLRAKPQRRGQRNSIVHWRRRRRNRHAFGVNLTVFCIRHSGE